MSTGETAVMLCPICLTDFEYTGQRACPHCGSPLDGAERAVLPVPGQPPHRSNAGSLACVVARIAGMFAAVGLGLGVGVLLFMWVTGAFERRQGIEDLGTVVLGGLALAVTFGFGLLIGVVMAIFAGLYASNAAESRTSAVVTGAVAGGIGHVALVLTLGTVLLIGFGVLEPDSPSVPTRSPFADAPCEETFGQGARECQTENSPDALESEDEVTVGNVSRLAIGMVPASLVGGLTSAILFTRRRRT